MSTKYTVTHEFVGNILNDKLSKLSLFIKIPAVFVMTSLIGFFASEILGTGRSLISEMIYGNGAWYMLLIYLSVRAVLLMVANNLGVTGGDILHLHYRTTTPEYTFQKLKNLIGKQAEDLKPFEKAISEYHQVPEN